MKKRIKEVLVASGILFSLTTTAQSLQEGLRALDFDKYEAARNIFESLTQLDNKNGDNWYYLGQAYMNLYKEDSAKWAYEKGAQRAPTNPSNFIGMGELLMAENKINEAKAMFKKGLDIKRSRDGLVSDSRALGMVAAALVNTENKITDEALGYIQSALELSPRDYDVLITAGDVYLEMNNGGQAASHYERAESVNPKRAKAYTRVASIWLRVKNVESTLADLNKALAIDSNYAPALKLMSELYYKAKMYEKAKYYYSKYLQNSEVSLANQQRFARILFNGKEYEDALELTADLLKQNNVDIYMYRVAGYSYFEVGESKKDTSYYRKGIAALNKFITTINPTKIISNDYEYLSKLYSRLPGNDSITVYYIEKAIETAPEKNELNREAGQIYIRIKKFDKAINSFESYLSKASRTTLVDYQLMGIAAYYGKAYTKSDSAYAKIIEQKADYADGYYWRGVNNAALDPDFKTPVAKDFFEKYVSMAETDATKNKQKLVSAYTSLGFYYIKNDKNTIAKEYFNKILKLEPENKTAKDILKQLK